MDTIKGGGTAVAEPGEDFSILLKAPRALVDLVDAEAKREQRSRTKQFIRILEERYGLVEGVQPAGDGA